MQNINFIEAVTERDVDLLLLEELSVSDAFVTWLVGRTTQHLNPVRVGVWHSLMDAEFGESDLILTYKNETTTKHALLIENKIDAVVQPEQAQRYHKRGDKGLSDQNWDEYKTCLVAPQKYLNTTSNAQLYDFAISYESLQRWFLEQETDPVRYHYRAKIIQEAIEKNRRGYTIVPDDRVSDFWFRYWELSSQIAPELELKEPSMKPSKSSWIHFYPSTLTKNMHIVHKLEKGVVDLQINGGAQQADQIVARLQPIIPDDVSIEITGKSLSLRKEVPIINHFGDFDDQKNLVENGIQTAQLLLEVGCELEVCGVL